MPEFLENKRILIFLRSLQLGGAERQAALLARYLKNIQKADVQVWAFYPKGLAGEILEKENIPIHIHPPKWEGGPFKKIFGLMGLIRDIRKFKPHIILPFTDYPNKVCGAIWKFTGAKSCVWNQRDEGREITRKFLEKLSLKITPCFVSNSLEGKNFLMNTFSVPEKKITMVPNAIQLGKSQETRAEWRKKLEIDENRFVAVMVANLQPFKDHPTLMESWRRVIDKKGLTDPPILLLAGRFGQTYKHLTFLAEELQLGDSIRFVGEVKDIPGLLSAVDLCVFSSKFEGCPNGVLEPMAAGLPVVATHITGIAEALGTDYPYLVPINRTERFADHILTFISNPDLRREIGEANKKRVAERFKPDRMFRAYTALLRKLISKR